MSRQYAARETYLSHQRHNVHVGGSVAVIIDITHIGSRAQHAKHNIGTVAKYDSGDMVEFERTHSTLNMCNVVKRNHIRLTTAGRHVDARSIVLCV